MIKPYTLLLCACLMACKEKVNKTQSGVSADTLLLTNASTLPDTLVRAKDTSMITLDHSMEYDTIPWEDYSDITAAQFSECQHAYHHLIEDTAGKRIIHTNKDIRINTAAGLVSLTRNPEAEDKPYAYYQGYIPVIKTHVIDNEWPGGEAGELILIDSATGCVYNIQSSFDNSCEIPLPSPDVNWLLVYASDMHFMYGSYITILKIDRHNKQAYTKYKSIKFEKQLIEGITWVNARSFAIQLKPVINEQDTASQYVKYQF